MPTHKTYALPNVAGMTTKEAARAYVAAGFKIFECAPGEKRPAPGRSWDVPLANGGALIDDLDDAEHFTEGANIGLPAALNGLVIIDIDNVDAAPAVLLDVLKANPTATSDTRPGLDEWRRHFVYRTDDAADYGQSTAGFPSQGWGDLRTSGYVVVEPSDVGHGYRWLSRDIAELPASVRGWLTKSGALATVEGAVMTGPAYGELDADDRGRIDRYVREVTFRIGRELDEIHDWPEGYRDERGRGWERFIADSAYRLARLAIAPWNDLTEDDAAAVLFDHAPGDVGFSLVDKWNAQLRLAVRKGAAANYPETPPSLFFDPADVVTPTARARLVQGHLQRSNCDLLYVEERGTFAYWDGTRWEFDADTKIHSTYHDIGDLGNEQANEIWRDAYGKPEAARRADEDTAKKVRGMAAKFHDSREIKTSMVDLANLRGIRAKFDEFDSHRHLIGVRNGVVDLRTGELRPGHRDDMLSKVIDVDYVPNATAPRWEQFIREVLVDEHGEPMEGAADFMQRLLGYGMTGESSEQRLPIFYGTGSNGKGVIEDTYRDLFAEYVEIAPFALFEEHKASGENATPAMARLKGARYVFASEGSDGSPMNEATIKQMTGQNGIPARFLYQNPFTYVPEFTIFLSTNHKPQFRGQDYGLWRRVLLIPFRRKFTPETPGFDPRLRDKIGAEAEGVLAWTVRGAVEWYSRGLDVPPAIEEETNRFKQESDKLAEFLAEFYVITGDPNDAIKASDVWRDYRDYCDEQGEVKWRRTTFFNYLTDGTRAQRITRVTGWTGTAEGRRVGNQTVVLGLARHSSAKRAPDGSPIRLKVS